VIDAFKAVLWGFLGVRRRSDYDADARNLRPRDVIAAGLAAAAGFVLLLFGIVTLVTR
jgi:hypothetical protein